MPYSLYSPYFLWQSDVIEGKTFTKSHRWEPLTRHLTTTAKDPSGAHPCRKWLGLGLGLGLGLRLGFRVRVRVRVRVRARARVRARVSTGLGLGLGLGLARTRAARIHVGKDWSFGGHPDQEA